MKKLLSLLIFAFLSLNALANRDIWYAISPEPGDTLEAAKAKSLTKQVIDEDRIIKSFEEAIAITLPQGISKKIGNQDNILVLETMSFSPTGAKLTAYMTCDVPRSEEQISFKGKDINFAPGGFTGGARLELIEDVNVKLGKNMTMVIKGSSEMSKTFVECDCKGYKLMGLQGEIVFSDSILVPVDAKGKLLKDKKVKVTSPFETQLIGWDDFMIEVGISPFKMKKLDDFSFSVNSAVFDFSELANSPSMVFPEAYNSSDFVDDNRKMWKGFFLKDLVVTYSGMSDSASIGDTLSQNITPTMEAHNLLIDNFGLSGQFSGNNLIALDKGTIGTWPFALDELSAEISKNQLSNCGFKGRITIPPLSDTATLGYEAFIDPGNQYSFNVKTLDTLRMDMLMAKMMLLPNSYIDISAIKGKFKPKAVLNGNLTIKANETDIAGVDFEELEITPEAPYLKAKAFSFGTSKSKQKFGKYPIAINNIGMVSEKDRTGLKFDLTLNLVEDKSGGFTGETGLTVFGKRQIENNRQKWKFDGVEVNKISVKIDGGAYKLNGSAEWFKKDLVYGNGFNGNLEAEFKGLPKIAAGALFGNINGMRYWYADALVNFSKGIPLFTGVNLYGFGGGAYHHMRQLGFDEKAVGTIGQTASGIVYKPDEQTFLGLKASVNLGLESKSLFNSDLTFEMSFNSNAGVDRINFKGNGYFMTPIEEGSIGLSVLKEKCNDIAKGKDPNVIENKDKNAAKSSIYAYVNLDFDFKNDVMHGILGTYINVGNGILQGTGPGGKAGEAVMHFAKDDWYIHIGTPTNRIGVKALAFAELNAYFMMGTKIPASPPPPEKVSDILGGINLDYMANLNALGEGKGISFGAGLQFNTGHKEFKPFYAQFDAGAGFDVMLKNYGNVNCKGLSGPLGINGWYANGQVWAYIEGSIGIEVHWRFINGKYEILNVGAAAVLQAKLPNPFWMHGIIGGRYSILGGLVSGNCRFDLTIGKECEIEGGGSPVQGIEVIAEVTPNDGSTDVNVFNSAQAVFNMPIGKVFELENLDGNKEAFKIELGHFHVKDGENILKGSLEWNAEKDVVAFNSFEILPPEKQLNLDVQVSFKELKNGTWQTIMDNGQTVIESLKTMFTTGKAPDYIPMENVLYSYPLPMMFNYYQNETDIGYIQLDKGQDYLFNPGAEWKQIGRFADKQGNKYEFSFTYAAVDKKVNFIRPANLQNNTIYSFELVNVPSKIKAAVDKNVIAKIEKKELRLEGQKDEDISTVEMTTKDAEGTIDALAEKNIFGTSFRTSLYNTLNDKLNAMQLSSYLRYYIYPSVHNLYIYNNGDEMFSDQEVDGAENYAPIIQFSANLDNNWYRQLIDPLVYESYPYEGLEIGWRDKEELGIPPVKAVGIFQYPLEPKLTEDQLINGIINTPPLWVGFSYKLPYYMDKDYFELKQKAANKFYCKPSIPGRIKYLLENSFKAIYKGDYNVTIKYVLPGTNTVSSNGNVKFVSPVGVE